VFSHHGDPAKFESDCCIDCDYGVKSSSFRIGIQTSHEERGHPIVPSFVTFLCSR